MSDARCVECGATKNLNRVDGYGVLCDTCKKNLAAESLAKLERSNKEARKDNG